MLQLEARPVTSMSLNMDTTRSPRTGHGAAVRSKAQGAKQPSARAYEVSAPKLRKNLSVEGMTQSAPVQISFQVSLLGCRNKCESS